MFTISSMTCHKSISSLQVVSLLLDKACYKYGNVIKNPTSSGEEEFYPLNQIIMIILHQFKLYKFVILNCIGL